MGENQQLLNRVTIECDNPNISRKELSATMKQKPNTRTLGIFRFHLGAYSLFHAKDTSKNPPRFFTRIGEVIGEPPVIYHETLHQKSKQNLTNYLQKKGYYNAQVIDTLITDPFNDKKAELVFKITAGNAYHINKFEYDIIDPFIKDIVLSDTAKSLISTGDIFDMDILLNERKRLLHVLKNQGYYYFTKSNIHYYADTALDGDLVNLKLTIKKSFEAEHYFLEEIFTRQTVKKVYFYINFDKGKYAVDKQDYLKTLDTVYYQNFTFLVDGKLKIKPKVILQANYIKPNQDYSQDNVALTQKHLAGLTQFKSINIQFTKSTEYKKDVWNAENPWLDAHIFLTPNKIKTTVSEAEATVSSKNYGVSGSITYLNRNIFRGAENFSSKFTGSLQTLSSTQENNDDIFNTFEFGTEIKLDVPKLMMPLQSEQFIKDHTPRTVFRLSFNHQNRYDYTRTIGNATFGYSWKSKNGKFHYSFNPIEYYTVRIFDFNEKFREQIQNLYIRYSFENQLITAMSWDMTYNNQNIKKYKNHWYIWTNLETSGNLMRTLGPHIGLQQSDDNAFEIFELEFAQYIKADIDARFYQRIDKNQDLVYHTYFGIGIPFGNSNQGLPFVKKYYIGGANDMRAWQVRELGPGSYSKGSLFDQIADMKMLFNIEYRFDIISFLEGAFFVDAGNIWAVDAADNRPGALFEFNRFYKEIAVGTGLGLRFDFKFLILRFDFGAPIYNPEHPENDRLLKDFERLELNDFTFNFGLGYPF